MKSGIVLPIGLVAALACASPRAETAHLGIEIRGSERFVRETREALDLLRTRCPAEFDSVQRSIGRIRESRRSGMDVHASPPTLGVSEQSSSYSPTWYASVIAHDAHHATAYFDHLSRNGPPVPDAVWVGTEAEAAANRFQLGVLEALGAPQHEIAYLGSLDGSHHDVNRDGTYDQRDYDARSW